jgi:spore coat protein A
MRATERSGCWRPLGAMVVPALVALWAPFASAAQVTLNPAADTTIYQGTDPVTLEDFEDNSCGAGTGLFSGVTNDGFMRRALLKFDIAGTIPPGAVINSVTLTIDVNRSGDNQDATMTLHPVATDWGEGTVNCDSVRGGGQGIDAGTGDATWLDAMFQQVSWASAGGDYGAASASAGIPTRGAGTWSDNTTGDGMVSDVQSWLDTPASNHGWIVIGDEARSSTTRRFDSREGSVKPTLVIDFTGEGSACCFESGDCSIQPDESTCLAAGGTSPVPASDTCEPNPCPQPSGACCNPDESCTDNVPRDVCEAGGGSFNGAGSQCSDNQVDCGLEPFVDPLPIPPVLQPTGTRADGVLQYTVEVVDASQQLHRDLPNTDVWTYNGSYPGSTIEARVGEPIEVTYINNLPAAGRRGGHLFQVDECPHGPNYFGDSPRIVTHLHGGHVPSRVDGHPELTILPGEIDVYEYPNNQLPGTLWYHDHALGITRLNVYAGMAGFYLLRDAFEDSLGLPAGDYEIAAVIQDRSFFADGSLFYPPTIQNAFFGDKILVNGMVWPFLNVNQGKYRFRFLNGSQARSYTLRLENLADPNQLIPFTLIGTDLGLIGAPVNLDSFVMAPAERFDIVIDFAGFPAGTEIVLRNDDLSTPRIANVMKFIVQGQPGHTAALPATLRPVPTIPENEATVDRYFRLEQVPEPCTGQEWLVRTLTGPGGDPTGEEQWDDIIKGVQLGTTEIWSFENPSNIMHPMHVHLVAFQVLDRTPIGGSQALPLDPWEEQPNGDKTWKDTVRVPPQTVVRVIARYQDYLGKFPVHCHILDHEDHEMMRQFQTTGGQCNNNGTCELYEDCDSCPNDCAEVSGAMCGNGLCEAGDGENCVTCPADCAGKQKGSASKQFCCGFDDGQVTNPVVNSCGRDADGTLVDDRCIDASNRLFCRESPRVMACCGDSLCEGAETETNCAVDCGAAPPPQCTYADPTVSISPTAQDITTDGGSVDYTVSVTNNDSSACAETTFDLSVSDSDDGTNFVVPSTLGTDPVTLAPGASTDVALTVTAQPGATSGVANDTSASTAADVNHASVTSNTVTTTINVGGAVDCSQYTNRNDCRNEPTNSCKWDNRNNVCVPR